MGGLWKYFEEHDAIFTALVAVLAIVGSYLAGVRGAKIQAKGGQDQAAAAREAAQIAAEAQRVAALWTVRQVQVAEFIQGVREVRRISELFFRQNAVADGLDIQLGEAQQVVSRKLAEIELIVPRAVVQAAIKLHTTLEHHTIMVLIVGPGQFFSEHVRLHALSPDRAESARANRAVNALRGLSEARGSGASMNGGMLSEAVDAVRAATDATTQQAVTVAMYASNADFPARLEEKKEELAEGMTSLVDAAREMLKSEDDVAPSVPEQRRRWWRAA